MHAGLSAGVHSRYDQLVGFVKGVVKRGAKRVRVHVLTDGRDVPDGTSKKFVTQLQVFAKQLPPRFIAPHNKQVLFRGHSHVCTVPRCSGRLASLHWVATSGALTQHAEASQDDLAAVSKDGVDARIASGGGRMCVTMDRYEVLRSTTFDHRHVSLL